MPVEQEQSNRSAYEIMLWLLARGNDTPIGHRSLLMTPITGTFRTCHRREKLEKLHDDAPKLPFLESGLDSDVDHANFRGSQVVPEEYFVIIIKRLEIKADLKSDQNAPIPFALTKVR